MYRVDITADLNDEDDTGYVWTFLDEARAPGQIKPGAIIVAGDEGQGRPELAGHLADEPGCLGHRAVGCGEQTGLQREVVPHARPPGVGHVYPGG